MPFQDYGYKPSGITRPRARPTPKPSSSSYYSGDEFGSGNIFTETSPGASTVNFGNTYNNSNDNDNNSYQAPSLVQPPAPAVTAPAAPTPAQIEAERQDRIARVFEAAGATLPQDTGRGGRAGRGIDLYSRDIFKTPYVATPDNTQEIEDYLQRTAVDDALRDALGIPEVYQGVPTQEEPETNIDMSVLQGALQPEPITVEELPDVTVKAGDTLSSIAASVDLPLQEVIDANPQIANPDMIRPGQKVNMPSRPLTAEERTALSNVDEITRSQINSITDSTGEFSDAELSNAITGSVKNPTKQSILQGAIEIETGGSGPVTEDNTYSLKAAKAVWTGVDDVLDTLPTDVAERLQYDYDNNLSRGSRTASQEDMQLLGEAMMEDKYDGGAAYKGRGLIQITGRNTYKQVEDVLKSKGIDVDLVANPELVNDPAYALPAALAYLEYVGLDDTSAEDMTTKELNNKINRGAGRNIAEERWEAVISSLRQAGQDEKADELELRNEYAAQDKAGTTVDGAIGPNSRRAMRTYLRNQNVAVPANITDDELVVLVNKN